MGGYVVQQAALRGTQSGMSLLVWWQKMCYVRLQRVRHPRPTAW